MIGATGFAVSQTTIGDLIVAVMDAAMAAGQDEEIAAEIASRVVVSILEKAAPEEARHLIAAFDADRFH